MNTLRQFLKPLSEVPAATGWYLADLGEAKGKQELFTHQSPQKLNMLRQHSLIESAVSSNRIEGVEIEESRIQAVIFGKSLLSDRDEEAVRGYRNALDLVHSKGASLEISESTIRKLHWLSRGGVGDAGEYKKIDNDIIEIFPDGRRTVRFKTVSVRKTPACVSRLVESWHRIIESKSVHPLVALGAFNLDFLCIHPFRDGNGRTSRLLFLLQCYHLGIEVGRYISLERLIETRKERYYETLKQSSEHWHESSHNPWHVINFFLYTLLEAYREFEQRVGSVRSPKGSKSELVLAAIQRTRDSFRVAEIVQACPGVSVDLVRRILKRLQAAGDVECLGRGQFARWRRIADQLGST